MLQSSINTPTPTAGPSPQNAWNERAAMKRKSPCLLYGSGSRYGIAGLSGGLAVVGPSLPAFPLVLHRLTERREGLRRVLQPQMDGGYVVPGFAVVGLLLRTPRESLQQQQQEAVTEGSCTAHSLVTKDCIAQCGEAGYIWISSNTAQGDTIAGLCCSTCDESLQQNLQTMILESKILAALFHCSDEVRYK